LSFFRKVCEQFGSRTVRHTSSAHHVFKKKKKEEKRRTFLHRACLPWLGIDSYHVFNNKCSSFAQVFQALMNTAADMVL
jgi:hypothetical protein